MKRTAAVFLLCAVILTCAAGASGSSAWPDWAQPYKDWAIANDIGEAFISAPYMQVSRAHAAQLLYEAAGSPLPNSSSPFEDTPERYADAIAWAAENGIIDGVSETSYEPSRAVAREEFAAILYRAAGSPDVSTSALESFDDAGSVSGWARDAMAWCVANGIMDGKAEDTLAPRDTIIVVEAVAMIERTEGISGEAVKVSSSEELKTRLMQAMEDAEQPPVFDISSAGTLTEIDIINVYNSILSDEPELKYAYDMSVELNGTELRCTFSYMPYRTGNYPEGFEGISVSSLNELIDVAAGSLDSESVNIRITDPSMTVDDMNKALQQAGGSWILCQLNSDATAITFTPVGASSRAESLEMLEETDKLAQEIVDELITDGMTELEKAEALYTYITENVVYDQRYYADRENMPYESQTAYGALHDNLAICGGYAQAYQLLLQKAGITCYTVSGSMGSEYHMWCIAHVGSEWRYFDPTSDRGRADYWYNCFNVTADELTRYVWDRSFVELLTK